MSESFAEFPPVPIAKNNPAPTSMQRAVYFRALATLFDSGVPLGRAFELLDGEMVGSTLGEASCQIHLLLLKGHTLSQAMKAQLGCFTNLQRCVVELGMKTGKLHVVLLHLADFEEGRNALNGKLRAALVYPILVFFLSLAFVAVVPTLVFDSLFEMLEESGRELSTLTLTVAWCAKRLSSPWTYLLFLVLGLALWKGFTHWMKAREAKLLVAQHLEALPGVGPVLVASRLAQFSRALALVVNSGYHLDRGLRVACSCCGSPVLEATADRLVANLRDGEPLAQCLERTGVFPNLYWQSVTAGEESGQLTRMLEVLAGIYDSELEHKLLRFAAMLEPLSLLCLGVIVGILVVACIQPLATAFSGL